MAIPFRDRTGQFTNIAALALAISACAPVGEDGTFDANQGTGGSASTGSAGSTGVVDGAGATGQGATTGIDNECTGVNTAADANVDIIFIIDNSGSMSDEIAKVRSNINQNFLSIIGASNLGWNLIMVTSKQGSPSNLGAEQICVDSPPAAASCADNPPHFRHVHCEVQSSDALTSGAFTYDGNPPPWYANNPNQGLMSLCGKMTIPGLLAFPMQWDQKTWRDFVREPVTKVFVIVTDDASEASAQDFDAWALSHPAMFGTAQDRRYIVHSIVGMTTGAPNAACTGGGNAAEAPGLKYQELSQITGGLSASICESDWSPIFNNIANDIVTTLGCEYPVPAPPAGETLDPNEVNVLYTPSGGSTEFIPRDTTAGCDDGANGWQWNAAKDAILLCGDACERVKGDPEGNVEIKFGCETVEVLK